MSIKYILGFLFLSLLFSCNEYSGVDCEDFNYDDCRGIEPDSVDIEIVLTQLSDSQKIPLVVFKGKYSYAGSQPEVYLIDTSISALYVVKVPLNSDYSVRAEYERNGEKVYSVDGTYCFKKEVVVCDTNCWSIKGATLDARLKDFD